MKLTIEQAELYFKNKRFTEILLEDSNQSFYNPISPCKYSLRFNNVIVTKYPSYIYFIGIGCTLCLGFIEDIELKSCKPLASQIISIVCSGSTEKKEYIFRIK